MAYRKPLRGIALIGFLIALTFGLHVVPASAAIYWDYGVNYPRFTVNHSTSLNQPWMTAVNQGRSSWNGIATSPVPVNISHAPYSTQNHYLSVGSFPAEPWFGNYKWSSVNGTFTIRINTTNIIAYTTVSERPNFARSTVSHEFGHALSLYDNPGGAANSSLMNHGRDRLTIYSPRPIDKERVIAWY